MKTVTLQLRKTRIQRRIARVKRWDESPMGADGYNVIDRGNTSQFQVINPYILGRLEGAPVDAPLEWCGSWSSNDNFSTLSHADVMKLANTQLVYFGYPWGMTDAEIVAELDVNLDGYTLRAKMGWLIRDTNVWGAQMRCAGDWWLAEAVQFIGMVHGGQIIEVLEEKTFSVRFNGINYNESMVRFRTFERKDWGVTYQASPYLIQSATVAYMPNSNYGAVSPKGMVLCPVACSYPDFDFKGIFQPVEHWLFKRWIVG